MFKQIDQMLLADSVDEAINHLRTLNKNTEIEESSKSLKKLAPALGLLNKLFLCTNKSAVVCDEQCSDTIVSCKEAASYSDKQNSNSWIQKLVEHLSLEHAKLCAPVYLGDLSRYNANQRLLKTLMYLTDGYVSSKAPVEACKDAYISLECYVKVAELVEWPFEVDSKGWGSHISAIIISQAARDSHLEELGPILEGKEMTNEQLFVWNHVLVDRYLIEPCKSFVTNNAPLLRAIEADLEVYRLDEQCSYLEKEQRLSLLKYYAMNNQCNSVFASRHKLFDSFNAFVMQYE